MNGTVIGLVFVAILATLAGYGPVDIVGAQICFLVLEWIGRHLIDRLTLPPFDRNKPY